MRASSIAPRPWPGSRPCPRRRRWTAGSARAAGLRQRIAALARGAAAVLHAARPGHPVAGPAQWPPAGPAGCWEQPSLWPQRLIVMTLDRVGADAGPDLQTLVEVRQLAPHAELIGAGGIRHAEDLRGRARRRRAGLARGQRVARSALAARQRAAESLACDLHDTSQRKWCATQEASPVSPSCRGGTKRESRNCMDDARNNASQAAEVGKAPWTCPFCSLLCDSYPVESLPRLPKLAGSELPARAARRLRALRRHRRRRFPSVDGQHGRSRHRRAPPQRPCCGSSRQPLFGGLATDVAGARALYRLAGARGAIADHAARRALMHGLRALQDRGSFYTTLAEVRNARRPDRLRRRHRRASTTPSSSAAAAWAKTCWHGAMWSSSAATGRCRARRPRRRVDCEAVALQGDLFDDRRRAERAGRRARRAAMRRPALRRPGRAQLRGARYAVLVWEAAPAAAHGALVVEAIQRLVATLNRSTRAAAFALGGSDGAATVQPGVHLAVGPAAAHARRAAAAWSTSRMRFDAAAAAGRRRGRCAAVGLELRAANLPPPAAALPRVDRSAIPALAAACGRARHACSSRCRTPGIGSAGHLFRTDGVVVLPLTRAVRRRAAERRDGDRCDRCASRRGERVMTTTCACAAAASSTRPTASTASCATCACATAASSTLPPRRAGRRRRSTRSGCVVMAGGIDLHTHIGGGKVNLARLLMPEDHRRGRDPWPRPPTRSSCRPAAAARRARWPPATATSRWATPRPSSRRWWPATRATPTWRWATSPILDHGAYVMLGNDELFLQMLAERRGLRAHPRLRRPGWCNATKAMGVKVVNPGGISAFKFNQRKLDVDERARALAASRRGRWCTRWRARCTSWACRIRCTSTAATSAWPATSTRRWRPSTRSTACPAHLTHVQFHAYGTEGPKKFSSAALRAGRGGERATRTSRIDVGQIMFGQTVTASGDTMRQHAQRRPRAARASGSARTSSATPAAAWCRSATASRATSTRCSGRSGWSCSCWCDDPWRVVLTTDHPNGGPFTQLPAPDPPADGQAASATSSSRGCIPTWRRNSRRCARSRAS